MASICFQDSVCNNNSNSNCGNYCDITNSNCQQQVLTYCSGQDNPSQSQWLQRWESNNCEYAIERNLFNIPSTSCSLGYSQLDLPCNSNIKQNFDMSSSGVGWASDLMYLTFQKYSQYGYQIGATPGTTGYNNLQNTLYRICCNFPIICQEVLQDYCQIYTSADLDINLFASQFCGCNLPVTQYSTYSELYNIEPYCTPYCNRSNAIPAINAMGDPIPCSQNVCLIDNTTYNLVNSQINGSINITQICGNVGIGNNAQYSCIIEGNTFDVINSVFQNSNIVIEEVCSSTQCIIDNPGLTGPAKITVPCQNITTNPYQQYDTQLEAQKAKEKNWSYVFNVAILVITVFVIFMILFFK